MIIFFFELISSACKFICQILEEKKEEEEENGILVFFFFLEIEFNVVCQLVHIDVPDYHLDSTLNIDCS
jgi:hypothetical protein